MNRREFQIGPGAASLLLIAVVLCMGVLGALSLVSARGDAQLSERSVQMAEVTADLNCRAEEMYAALDATMAKLADAQSDGEYLAQLAEQLPERVQMDGRVISWMESDDGGRRLSCAVEVAELGEFPRANWTEHRVWTELDEEDPSGDLLFGDDDGGLLFGDDAALLFG